MRHILAAVLLATVAIAPEYGSGARISPAYMITQGPPQFTSSDWVDAPGLTFKKELPLVDRTDRITQVDYNGNEGVIVCDSNGYPTAQVRRMASHLAEGINTPGLAVISASSFSKLEM
ncbi:hypothetical protein THASP1DRAFT_26496, partial [Thamnocephalis sphaerospora]